MSPPALYARSKLQWFAFDYVCNLEYILLQNRFFFSSSWNHSGIKKWQLISVSFFFDKHTHEVETTRYNGELIILIKSILIWKQKNNLRTSKEKPATQNKITKSGEEEPQETSFWLRTMFLSHFSASSPYWKFFGVVVVVLHLSLSFKTFKNKNLL